MAQQTAVELLHEKSNELITQYLDNKITKRDLITMHHNILYPHKEIEKEQILNACEQFSHYPFDIIDYYQYYNETYNK
jgi:hypothetical protein